MGAPLVGRTLLQSAAEPVKPPVAFNNSQGPCILLWADTIRVSFQRDSKWIDEDLTSATFNQSMDLSGSLCNENSSV